MDFRPRRLLVAMVCIALTSCGGGGGGGTPTPEPPILPPPTGNTNVNPIIGTLAFSATEDQDFSGQLTASDANGDALVFTNGAAPTKGTLVSFAASGAFTYRPNANAFGTDSFAVTVSDGRGGTASATIALTIAGANDAPVANHDRLQLAGPTLDVPVLANDVDLDNERLTITITEPALVGTATVTAGNTVSLTNFPAFFRGLTRFRYRITDSAGMTSEAYANVFVDTTPFHAVLALNIDGRLKIGITDFTTAEPRILNNEDPSGYEVNTFRPSENGEVVVYQRTAGQATSNISQLCTVRTAPNQAPACFQIPDELRFLSLYTGNYVYSVSPDGRWIAAVLVRKDAMLSSSLYLIDTSRPSEATSITAIDAPHAVALVFSKDSQFLYYIGNDRFTGTDNWDYWGLGIYRIALGVSDTPVRITAPQDPANRVDGLSVSADGTRVMFQRREPATDLGGVWFVNTATLGTEHRLSHDFAFDEGLQAINGRAVFANPAGTTMAYVMWRGDGSKDLYMTTVSADAPNPHLVGTAAPTMPNGLYPLVHPTGDALLYNVFTNSENSNLIYEEYNDPALPAVMVGAAGWSAYDSSGEHVILRRNFWQPPTNISNIQTVTRRTFGSPQNAGTPGLESIYVSGFNTGAFVIGESADGTTAVKAKLVNLTAPNATLVLSDADTHLGSATPYWLVD